MCTLEYFDIPINELFEFLLPNRYFLTQTKTMEYSQFFHSL